MPSFKELCQDFFGKTDFYEILGLESSATEKQIKKAYHKVSLKIHPDRVDEADKKVATEKFKVLGRIHSILQDKEKRRHYDDLGEVDDENDTTFNWMEYWRALFKPIERKDIIEYEKGYVGSDTELRDIKKAYVGTRGDMDKMLEMIPFSSCDSEERFMQILRGMVDAGEVEEYDAFFKESKLKKRRRRNKWEKERKLSEEVDLEALETEIRKNSEKRINAFSDFISGIEEKYSRKRVLKSLTDSEASSAKKRKRTLRSKK